MDEGELFRKVIEGIFRDNLRIAKYERYLFFTDANSRWEENPDEMVERRKFLHAFYEAFTEFVDQFPNGVHDKYDSTKQHGGEPTENIWKLAIGCRSYSRLIDTDYFWKLKHGNLTDDEWRQVRDIVSEHADDVVDCIIAFPWYSTTHTRFRQIVNECGSRYVSMPFLTESVMRGPMLADWVQVAEKTEKVYEILRASSSLHLTCPAGSDFVVDVANSGRIHKDSGDFSSAGVYGNLPAGEAYLVPTRGSARGRVVFTSAPLRAKIAPTCLLVQQGTVCDFVGDTEYGGILNEKFAHDANMRNVAEVGIGTNPLARDVSSIIEGEKIEGTVHLALGTDSSIGGDTQATEHLDHVLVGPTLSAVLKDGGRLTIVREGKLEV